MIHRSPFTKPTRVPCQRTLSTESPKLPQMPPEPGEGKSPVTWKSVGITLGLGSIFLAGMAYWKSIKDAAIEKEKVKTIGKASLGGEWELVDQTGKVRTDKDFQGQWVLLYFGFTHCPDVCPEELEKIVEAVDIVDAKKGIPNLQPIFITVDPDRDSPKAVAEYIAEFSPKLIGMTGTNEQIEKVTRAFRVFFSVGPKDDDNDYIVDHSIITYLVGPDGFFVNYYGQNKKAHEIANDVRVHMAKFKS
eukprot:GHVO01036977.1.p1 GENE.GHVO01036977.1~~GHVO01036977.1.p1  ORF type:complete len:262 (+),score=34.84 GHVO01036977.1:46-786(+)